jgi:hypothetical protein
MGLDEEGGRRSAARLAIAGLVVAVLGILISVAIAECWWFLGQCEDEASPVRIDTSESLFNAPGDDDPADEYVCLVNVAEEPTQMVGWQLRKRTGDLVNTLPDFTLPAGGAVRVHAGRGRDSGGDLFGTNRSSIWRNDGDSVTLVDADGEEVASESYGPRRENEVAGSCSAEAPTEGGGQPTAQFAQEATEICIDAIAEAEQELEGEDYPSRRALTDIHERSLDRIESLDPPQDEGDRELLARWLREERMTVTLQRSVEGGSNHGGAEQALDAYDPTADQLARKLGMEEC